MSLEDIDLSVNTTAEEEMVAKKAEITEMYNGVVFGTESGKQIKREGTSVNLGEGKTTSSSYEVEDTGIPPEDHPLFGGKQNEVPYSEGSPMGVFSREEYQTQRDKEALRKAREKIAHTERENAEA